VSGGSFEIDVGDAPVEATVHRLVEYAALLHVSDLFILAGETETAITVRHLGTVRRVAGLAPDRGKRCISHIKVMANMDVAEHRRPQDGRWILKLGDKQLDLRVNSIPTLHGEDLTLRLLARDSVLMRLDGLGLVRHETNALLNLLGSPSGLILVTGPTGAGKTTTLYACLNHLNTGERKINTIEDPIEYTLEGVRQSQVNDKLGLGFPDLLRSVLRQAPDVILIGEIRDSITAETAVRAANSGHLVLATLHAPIAAGAIQSMLALGVQPHFLAGSLRGVIAQRLLRTLCASCKIGFDLSMAPHTFEEVKPWLEPGQGTTLFAAKGCGQCRMTGYVARTGVFEIMTTSKEMRKLIMERQPTQILRAQSMQEGIIEIRQAALLSVARGETTTEEVLRVIPPEYLGLEA
jgi:type II secretory ATPase GspE/PulE/Tfp pilus assembly ATPase PilB-like protein